MDEVALIAGYHDLDPLEGVARGCDQIDDRTWVGDDDRTGDLHEALGDREVASLARQSASRARARVVTA